MKNKTSLFKRKYHQYHPYHPTSPANSPRRTFYTSKDTLKTADCLSPSLKQQRRTFTNAYDQPLSPKLFHKFSVETRQNNRTTTSSNPNGRMDNIQAQKKEYPLSFDSSLSDLKWKPAKGSSLIEESPKCFIENLKKNEIFYCCGCYQYVFEVEKNRHFPECRDCLIFANFQKEKILSICWQRVERIVQLSRYTSTRQRQVQDLFLQVKKCQFSRIYMINYPQNCKFFKLDQILQAFVYTYEQLLKGRIHPSKQSHLFTCI